MEAAVSASATRVGQQEAKEGPRAAAESPPPHFDLPPFDLFEPHFLAYLTFSAGNGAHTRS